MSDRKKFGTAFVTSASSRIRAIDADGRAAHGRDQIVAALSGEVEAARQALMPSLSASRYVLRHAA